MWGTTECIGTSMSAQFTRDLGYVRLLVRRLPPCWGQNTGRPMYETCEPFKRFAA